MTPNFFIHAPILEGGLGVAVLQNAIPMMHKARLEKLLGCKDPVVAAVARSSMVVDMLSRDSVVQHVGDVPVCDKNGLKRTLSAGLHNSVDGRSLKQSSRGSSGAQVGGSSHSPDVGRQFHW